MYSSEKMFIRRFLAGLKKIGVNEIPYDNEKFYNGAKRMRDLFQQHRGELGECSNELAMLFLQNPIGGTFSEFRDGIARQNGGLMTFENPYYVVAKIHIDSHGMNTILNRNSYGVSDSQILSFSKAFCEGAGITYNAEG